MAIHLDLNTVHKLVGDNIEINNKDGLSKIALKSLVPLVFDKDVGNVTAYYDNTLAKLILTMAGIDSVYLDNTDLRFVNNPRFIQYLAGLKANGGTEYLRVIEPSISPADFKSIIESASNKVVWLTPGTYILTYDTTGISGYSVITLPQNCIIVAFGAEIKFRYSNTNGNFTQRFVRINQKGCVIMGGTWWVDRANSAGGSDPLRTLFYVDNGADPLFYKCRIANSSGATGVALSGSGTFGLFIGCLFKPVQNNYTDWQFLSVENGASIDVPGCVFDGHSTEGNIRCSAGIVHSTQNIKTIIRCATFKHLAGGVKILFFDYGADLYYVHISDCDFVEMRNVWSGDLSPIMLWLFNTNRRLFDVTIENCKFEGGNSSSGQIGVPPYASYQYGLKNLVIRNCDFVASSAYGTAGYALYFPAYSEAPDTFDRKNEIAEISGCNIRGSYYYKPLNIHPDILANIGKFEVRIYS